MWLELHARSRGLPRALLPSMTDIDKIERLNADQFATPADRIVFRARASQQRLSANKALFAKDVGRRAPREVAPIPSLPRLAGSVRVAHDEPTLYVRAKKVSTSTTTGALLATVFA